MNDCEAMGDQRVMKMLSVTIEKRGVIDRKFVFSCFERVTNRFVFPRVSASQMSLFIRLSLGQCGFFQVV